MSENTLNTIGIVRRMDDLGRVVIPREIRQRLKLHDGTPLEEIVTEEGIFLRPIRTHPEAHRLLGDVLDILEQNKDAYESGQYQSLVDAIVQARITVTKVAMAEEKKNDG